jgi:predicted amidophosphoribosyltransferase
VASIRTFSTRETREYSGAFVFKHGFIEKLKDALVVFLVDDIVTIGVTLREAAKVLKKAGVGKVYGVAFAYG